MVTITLHSVEEQLRSITDAFTLEDWKSQEATLLRIRNLTSRPRQSTPRQPAKDKKEFAEITLEKLWLLPDSGEWSIEDRPPTLDHLKDQEAIHNHCREEGLRNTAIQVVKATYDSLQRPEDRYNNIWQKSRQFYRTEGTVATRLLNTNDVVEDEEEINAARYRVNALLFAFEYRARCERLDTSELTTKKEAAVMKAVMSESGRTSEQIHTLLKRGRFYAQWIKILGPGAILTLGVSLASNNYMTTIDHTTAICVSIPYFCERAQKLSKYARQAIVQAFILSGQSLPDTIPRVIDLPDVGTSPTNIQIASITYPGISNDGVSQHGTTGQFTDRTQECFPLPGRVSAMAQEYDAQNSRAPWLPFTDCGSQQESMPRTASIGPHTVQNNMMRSATSGAVAHPASLGFSSDPPFDVGTDGSSWNGPSYNDHGGNFDLFWETNFSASN